MQLGASSNPPFHFEKTRAMQTLFAENYAMPQWRCVHFFPDAQHDINSFRTNLERMEIALLEIHGTEIRHEEQLMNLVSHAFKFPDYFGRNWNALNDCITDLSWFPAKGYVLLIHGAEASWRQNPEMMGTFVEIWLSSAEFWNRLRSIPFHVIFVMGEIRSDVKVRHGSV